MASYPVTVALLTNGAFGNYGGRARGAIRRAAPRLLMCVHVTGNAQNLGATAATNERNYANRAGSSGPSAHDYLNRDGSAVHAIDTTYAAWSNGLTNAPKIALAIVKTVLALVEVGYNPNELYAREVECVGYGTADPITAAQLETLARMIAADSHTFGIPISRATVGQHSDLDTVNRSSCAGLSESQLAGLIARAVAIADPLAAIHAELDRIRAEATYLSADNLAALEARITKIRADLG